jgi:alkaline phosphatase
VSGSRYYKDSLIKLRQAVKTFADSGVDLILDLGDSVDEAETVEEERSHLYQVKDVLESVGVPVHFLIGNHDVAEMTKSEFLEVIGHRSSYYSFDIGDVHVVILDSNINADGTDFSAGNFEWDDAWVGAEQIQWLKDDLAAAGDRSSLIFCHGVLNDLYRPRGGLNGHVVRDASEVRHVLETQGAVKGVFMGHHHSGGQVVVNGIPYVTLKAMTEGSVAEEHNAYAALSLYASGRLCVKGYGHQPSVSYHSQLNALEVVLP